MRSSPKFLCVVATVAAVSIAAQAYPPGVGIMSDKRSCTGCHASTGPWSDETMTIAEILDGDTKTSLRRPNGSFQIDVVRGQTRRVITILGRRADDQLLPPTRNGWTFVDTAQLSTSSFSKFAPGWDVNLNMACRMVGDTIGAYPGAQVTVLPMTVRPTDAARDAELEWQCLLTTGSPVKGRPDTGLVANFLTRQVRLHVLEK